MATITQDLRIHSACLKPYAVASAENIFISHEKYMPRLTNLYKSHLVGQ